MVFKSRFLTHHAPVFVLVASCLAHLFWGSVTTPSYYVNAIQVQYNYTQSQVELILPVLSVAKVASPIPAFVFQTCGARPTISIAMLLTSIGYIMLWAAKIIFHPYGPSIVFVYASFFFLGFGSSFFNLAVLTVSAQNFQEHRGKAVSLLMTCYSASPLLSLGIYRHWFSDDLIENDASQDISGFMLFSCVSTAITAGVCLIFVRVVPSDRADEETLVLPDKVNSPEKEQNWIKVIWKEICFFVQWPVQMVIWTFSLTYAVYCAMGFNLAVYAKISGVYNIYDICFSSFHVVLFITRFAIGFISDYFAGIIPKTVYLFVTGLLVGVNLGVASFISSGEVILYSISFTVGLAGGVFRPIIVTIIANEWKAANFAKIWGVNNGFSSLVLIAWLSIFPRLISTSLNEVTGQECHGTICLKWPNRVTSAMMFLSCICSFLLAFVKKL